MKIRRKNTRVITLGNTKIGGEYPVIVQSMLKKRIENHGAIIAEIEELENSGCEIIRIAIPDNAAVDSFYRLKKVGAFKVPVVADIHFDYRLAIDVLDAGADCVRINPGNIGGKDRLAKVVLKARELNSALRIGVNSGSLDKKILKRNSGNIVRAMVDSTIENVRFFEENDFNNFKISAKASSVPDTIEIYREISSKVDYPLHLGITEAGPAFSGAIKSAVGLGVLLSEGIGDTLRVSLTDRASAEVRAAFIILSSLGLRYHGTDIISCPTCGRTNVDLKSITDEIEEITQTINKNIKIAIMGCIVNGPGEAKEADIGIAYGKEKAAIFKKGKIIKRVNTSIAIKEFEKELKSFII
jgi:(E)-4-hydroxy-3-methylbut-2-enyl-diphosphate synthase